MVYLTGSNADKNFSGGYELWIQKRYRICSFNMESAERRKKISICTTRPSPEPQNTAKPISLTRGSAPSPPSTARGRRKFSCTSARSGSSVSRNSGPQVSVHPRQEPDRPARPLLDYRQDKLCLLCDGRAGFLPPHRRDPPFHGGRPGEHFFKLPGDHQQDPAHPGCGQGDHVLRMAADLPDPPGRPLHHPQGLHLHGGGQIPGHAPGDREPHSGKSQKPGHHQPGGRISDH